MKFTSENISEAYQKNKKLFADTIRKLKKKPPRDLDYQFEHAHEQAFSKIDCLQCANCCKTTSPMLFEKDIERLALHLKLRPGDFIEKYLYMDPSDNIYAFKSAPCPFLGADNYCSVYEHRPKACKEYPHTNQRKMHTLLNLAEKNAAICPAVQEIIKQFEI